MRRSASFRSSTRGPSGRHDRVTRQNRTAREGAVLVETALILPVFFLVVLGIVEFGRAMMVGQMMTNATREACRAAIVDGSTNSEVTNHIVDVLDEALGVDPADITVTIEITEADGNEETGDEVGNASARDLIRVRTEVPFEKVAYITPDYLNSVSLKAEASMRHE